MPQEPVYRSRGSDSCSGSWGPAGSLLWDSCDMRGAVRWLVSLHWLLSCIWELLTEPADILRSEGGSSSCSG